MGGPEGVFPGRFDPSSAAVVAASAGAPASGSRQGRWSFLRPLEHILSVRITVTAARTTCTPPPTRRLLYVLRDELQLDGPKFGCGLAQCSACTVIVKGRRSAPACCRFRRSTTPGDDRRGAGNGEPSASGAARVHRRAGGPVRLLHLRHGDRGGRSAARAAPRADRRADPPAARWQSVPLRVAGCASCAR